MIHRPHRGPQSFLRDRRIIEEKGRVSSVTVSAVNLLLCVICLLKGKVVTGVTGTVIGVVALVGAIRLAKPGSWWAAHLYASRPRHARRAASRYSQRHQERWNRCETLLLAPPLRNGPG